MKTFFENSLKKRLLGIESTENLRDLIFDGSKVWEVAMLEDRPFLNCPSPLVGLSALRNVTFSGVVGDKVELGDWVGVWSSPL